MQLRHVTVDCAEPYELAGFWSAVTGWPVSADDAPGDAEVLVEAPSPVPGLLFIRVPERKAVKNRLHLDWSPTDRTRDAEVERVLALGATIHEDHCLPDGRGWVTMRDPEGNEFCIERSPAEATPPPPAEPPVSPRPARASPLRAARPVRAARPDHPSGPEGRKAGRPEGRKAGRPEGRKGQPAKEGGTPVLPGRVGLRGAAPRLGQAAPRRAETGQSN